MFYNVRVKAGIFFFFFFIKIKFLFCFVYDLSLLLWCKVIKNLFCVCFVLLCYGFFALLILSFFFFLISYFLSVLLLFDCFFWVFWCAFLFWWWYCLDYVFPASSVDPGGGVWDVKGGKLFFVWFSVLFAPVGGVL